MVAILLSLVGLFALPITHAQAPARAPEPVVRTERVRAAPSFPVASTASAPARAVAAPAPKPAAKAPAPAKPKQDAASAFAQDVEAQILKLVNAERIHEGLGALASDAKLAGIARAHSADMLNKGYFSHTNTAGCGSSCRVTNAGYAWRATGENIYTMEGYDMSASETARQMVDGWMKSSGHRANILNSSYTNHGIGLAVSGKTIYATSVFALPL